MLPLLLIFYLLWQGGPVSTTFWTFVYGLTGLLNVSPDLINFGHQQFLP